MFPDHLVVHGANPKEYTDTLLKLLRQFGNVARYELNNKNQLHSDIPEQIMRKESLQELRVCKSMFNKRGGRPLNDDTPLADSEEA